MMKRTFRCGVCGGRMEYRADEEGKLPQRLWCTGFVGRLHLIAEMSVEGMGPGRGRPAGSRAGRRVIAGVPE